ncbi:transposase family protein [Streptomyces mirabilis]|uniref:transposase family protein n=1 Tax=Streptomyces mirabilis TaxID=68239 RepID=UPI0036892491
MVGLKSLQLGHGSTLPRWCAEATWVSAGPAGLPGAWRTSCRHNGQATRRCRQSGISVDALSTHPSRPCPDCGVVSRRVHSRYRPTLADCPVGGRPWLVRLTVRRFFQDAPTCLVCRFVEEG